VLIRRLQRVIRRFAVWVEAITPKLSEASDYQNSALYGRDRALCELNFRVDRAVVQHSTEVVGRKLPGDSLTSDWMDECWWLRVLLMFAFFVREVEREVGLVVSTADYVPWSLPDDGRVASDAGDSGLMCGHSVAESRGSGLWKAVDEAADILYISIVCKRWKFLVFGGRKETGYGSKDNEAICKSIAVSSQ
jgi:hypothetical protein